MYRVLLTIIAVLTMNSTLPAWADAAPWGSATPAEDVQYAPQKVVYDITVDDPESFQTLLDRMSGLSAEYGADPFDASIIAVLHGPEMRFFDIRQFKNHEALVRRAQSLTVGGVIELRMCQRAAAGMGLLSQHIHGFIDLVPMGDAEIIRLQQEEGYAYMK